ncbi:MAG: helix-hairpin-helix domain-containing protein [Anaerococcus sp.]|nr:helix-hairpin-helix domain-containing protein [Anaerococcus sp.]
MYKNQYNDKDNLIDLIEPSSDITIRIGDENYFPEAKDCSIISAEYSLDGRPIGKIGLIGPKRKENLLKHFKSIDKIKNASLEELMEVESMNEASANSIYQHFRGGNNGR